MRDRIRSSVLAAVVVATLSRPDAAAAQGTKIVTGVSQGSLVETPAVPSAVEVFARHVQAIGGRDAVMSTSAIKTVGKMEMPAQGISASMESVSAPNKSAMKLSIPGIGDITNGYDGQVAWEVNPMSGPRIKTEREKATAQEDSDFRASMLFAKERYRSVECVGQADFGGETTWHVKSVLKSGRVVPLGDDTLVVPSERRGRTHSEEEHEHPLELRGRSRAEVERDVAFHAPRPFAIRG